MSGRTTRSRARAAIEVGEQPKIRDVFTVGKTRSNSRSRVKNLKSAPAPVLDLQGSPPKIAKKEEVEEKTNSINDQPETSKSECPVPTSAPDAESPSLKRKVPTPTPTPTSPSRTARKALFGKPAPADEFPFEMGSAPKPRSQKIRTVAQLQAALAAKGAARVVHEQNIQSKSRQVDEQAKFLKSPVKIVPSGHAAAPPPSRHLSPAKKQLFTSPLKKIQATSSKTPKKIEKEEGLVIPEFVLPTHRTPIKEPDSDEERERQEKRRIFEYGKAALLVQQVKENSDLPLPKKYLDLHEAFRSCDRIVSIFVNRQSRCAFSSLQKNIQSELRRDFTLKTLAQLMAVYPKSYDVRMEEQRTAHGQVVAGKFEHILTPNTKDDLDEFMIPETTSEDQEPLPLVVPSKCLSPTKSPKKCAPLPRPPQLETGVRFEGWRINNRSHVMRHLLVEKVKSIYKKFMEKRTGNAPGSPIRRMHPSFMRAMDSECPDIEEAPLPQPPRKDSHLKTMRDFFETVDETPDLPKGVDRAINLMKSPVKIATTSVPLSPKKFAETQKSRAGNALLERIRAKEAAKKAAEAARDPEAEKRRAMLEKLQHSLLRALLNMYSHKQCRSIEMGLLLEKMNYSCNVPKSEISLHIELLCDVAGSICRIKEVAGRKYVQIDDNKHNDVRDIVRTELEKLSAPSSSLPSMIKGR